MESSTTSRLQLTTRRLPWFVAGGALLLYLVTLNHWISLNSLTMVSRVARLDWWMPSIQYPLYLLVTLPVHVLPAGLQPVALNIFSALCAALTLAQLARSVALLPHDRTRDQRQRETNEQSLLSIRLNWVPVLLAALALGLQLTFWENATAATGESLNLLLFAFAIRCLLEFRIDGRQAWLDRLAVVCGLGATNDWAIIGFFPLFLGALVWIKGASFFRWKFILRMTLLGLVGLLPYLYLPLIGSIGDQPFATFGELMRLQLGAQKNSLMGSSRTVLWSVSVATILPVICAGIRWPSVLGEVNRFAAFLTNLMFPLVHIIFLGASLWIMADYVYSPRVLDPRSSFLTLYYLGALSIGYYSGFFLLVFGSGGNSATESKGVRRVMAPVLVGLILLAAVTLPVIQLVRNIPQIRQTNGPELSRYAAALVKDLPAGPAYVLGDNSTTLLLAQASLARFRPNNEYVLIDTGAMPFVSYHFRLAKHYGSKFTNLFAKKGLKDIISDPALIQTMLAFSKTKPVYYLHHSFGYYFEVFYPKPHGLVNELVAYPPGDMQPPVLTPAELDANLARWQELQDLVAGLDAGLASHNTELVNVASLVSRSLNEWGVQLQVAKRLAQAHDCFERAARLFEYNVSARINLDANEALQKKQLVSKEKLEKSQLDLSVLRSWRNVLSAGGPVNDANFSMQLGQIYLSGSLKREAATEFLRSREINPNDPLSHLAVADVYLQVGMPDKTLLALNGLRHRPDIYPLNVTNEPVLIRMEALALVEKKEIARAEQVALEGDKKYPQNSAILATLTQIYSLKNDLTNALASVEQQRRLQPDNFTVEITRVAILTRMNRFEPALEALNHILQNQPGNAVALLYRAGIQLDTGRLDLARADFETLRRTNPKMAIAYRGLGEVAVRQNRPADAVRYYEEFLSLSPEGSPEARAGKARLDQLKAGLSAK